ncbi:hypothetical protein NDU88_012081 [Pleurodeles waltl]|uniref:Secreted protein n=1 Tax=Pleurodeles waltl TaxID=8319 RepID=A0AAV7QZ52_PLEWA|nr:hypothetical protein NDU88_012081 [Pleurodeles waltl]
MRRAAATMCGTATAAAAAAMRRSPGGDSRCDSCPSEGSSSGRVRRLVPVGVACRPLHYADTMLLLLMSTPFHVCILAQSAVKQNTLA